MTLAPPAPAEEDERYQVKSVKLYKPAYRILGHAHWRIPTTNDCLTEGWRCWEVAKCRAEEETQGCYAYEYGIYDPQTSVITYRAPIREE